MKNLAIVARFFEMVKFHQNRYFAAPILNILVPQTGHVPDEAGLPFFMVTCCTFSASLFWRHLTQYIVILTYAHPLSVLDDFG